MAKRRKVTSVKKARKTEISETSGSLTFDATHNLSDADQRESFTDHEKHVLQVLELSKDRALTQTDIATKVGIHQSQVSRIVARYSDKRILARILLESSALALVETLVNTDDPSIALKTLKALNVVEDTPETEARVTVALGSPFQNERHPALKPPSFSEMELPVLDVKKPH